MPLDIEVHIVSVKLFSSKPVVKSRAARAVSELKMQKAKIKTTIENLKHLKI